MSLSALSPMATLSPATTNAFEWHSTAICQKLLYVCYYYARCFGMVAFGIKRCKESNEIHTQPNSRSNAQLSQRTRFVLQAHIVQCMLWFNIVVRFIFCTYITYSVFSLWISENYIFSLLIYSLVITITICPTIMLIVEICHRRRIIQAINDLFQLLQAITELHCSYEIFHWTHVVFVTLKIVTFMYEIIICLQTVLLSYTWFQVVQQILQNILLIQSWINLHIVTLLYVCVEAMYGSLNHYMKHTIILRLKVIQSFDPIAPPTQVNDLKADFANFIGLFKKVHRVALELHYLWQIPVVCTVVSIYIGTISVVYLMIWQYFAADIINMQFAPLVLKFVLDIVLLSLTAHRAIESSQLIGCMGLENVVLLENKEWYRLMEQFLYYINLYDFKLNCLGLFNITNATTLTFISGILTSISIFVPFFIKTYWIQKLLEKQN